MKPDMKHEAKAKMLQELKKMATDMMGGDLKDKMDGMQKVTVAAKDEQGLKSGLDKAKELVGQMPEMDKMAHQEAQDAGSSEETDESASEDYPDDEEMEEESSPEELQQKIKDLQAKLMSMKK